MTDVHPHDPLWLDREQYPFDDHYLDLDGHRIHFVDTGAGQTLLFLHGNPTWSFVYRKVIAALAPHSRCVAPDLPGFGLSTAAVGYSGTYLEHADVIQRFVEALDLRDIVLVVQDWGGPIGLRLVERQPERFRAVVICNSWAWPVADNPHFARFAGLMGGRVGSFLIRHANLFVNAMVPMGHRRRRLSRAEMRHYRAPLATPARRELSAVLPREIIDATSPLAELAEGLGVLRDLPVLIVWGDSDMAFREPELLRWRAEVPEATVQVIEGAGHFVQSDAPGEVGAAIASWLERLEPGLSLRHDRNE
ncbi:alpha/beta fold hydrolase [Herbiconiux moechotypicola]|uniref:Haloalkane dehalogenase n=1 Tax=Herbiconiux moechotypicola TaxID=637393 RepID=A0ABN3DFF5_9MICO|nr:alpha/beta fold hydrolase [Herbiconiux moechotypicola]MCS5729418.1 alpha/beta fold hydrolase [Herbiconiux moechotypicola]